MSIKPSNIKYKRGIEILINRCKDEGIDVIFVDDNKTKDFVGMNEYAGKAFGYPIPDDTIYIDNNLELQTRYETLKHEVDEIHKMEKGSKYWPAHLEALRKEKVVVTR